MLSLFSDSSRAAVGAPNRKAGAQKGDDDDDQIDLSAGHWHTIHVFDHLRDTFDGKEPKPFDGAGHCPFFVTLKKRTPHGEWVLRGCIGTLSARPLTHLGQYAHKSAFEDRRFDPLHEDELPQLQVSVSLLVGYEPAKSWDDWTVGLHGIIIELTVDGREYSATYLPEVAEEQGWDQRAAVSSLVKKAGYHKALSAAQFKAIKVTRYRSSKHTMTYDEWMAYRMDGMLAGSSSHSLRVTSKAAAPAVGRK